VGTEMLFQNVSPWMPYRCLDCWGRFWVFKPSVKKKVGIIICFLLIILAGPFLIGNLYGKIKPVPKPSHQKEDFPQASAEKAEAVIDKFSPRPAATDAQPLQVSGNKVNMPALIPKPSLESVKDAKFKTDHAHP
jgi:hypothetical protein